jgi:hypothetical protein
MLLLCRHCNNTNTSIPKYLNYMACRTIFSLVKRGLLNMFSNHNNLRSIDQGQGSDRYCMS